MSTTLATNPPLSQGVSSDRTAAAWTEFSTGLRAFFARKTGDDAVADDLLQDVFLRVHERGGQLADEQRIAGWIWQIARRTLTDHYRRSKPDSPLSGTEASPLVDPIEDELGVLALWLKWEVKNLPPAYRQALELTELQGLTMHQAADVLGLSVSGTKSRVQRGRAMLRQRLLRCCHVELDHAGRPVDFQAKQGCGC